MYTELVGNLEANKGKNLGELTLHSNAMTRAQALGLLGLTAADNAGDRPVSDCGNTCMSTCIYSPGHSWGCGDRNKSELPSQANLLSAAAAL